MATEQWVAIVDDDEAFRKSLERVFRSAGFHVESFGGAESFLAGYIPKDEACIILDLRMPFVGGLELHERMKARGIDLPVIIYTGNADVPVTVRAMQAGTFAVLEKPLSNELLIEQVRLAIASTRGRRARRGQIAVARARLALLTERERETALHLVDGLSAREVADRLGISPRTVEAHRMNLFRKLEIKSGAELSRLFVLAELGDV
ncbi:response regulator transcription factor [Azoarcus sp. KH32C]|uniref:response regulator transcription factor n=1 Tax=Azoarcus sp. KH32C TaxID=748247 RepID=UPI0002385F8F|nr:response regulator [Azoarcus sp. KH32C]BAL22400.1 response regulator receiver protein [Azoarcus sp. KH32C]